MRRTAFLILAASAALTAAPASAQAWRVQPTAQREIRADIGQLQNQIARARQRGTVSSREAVGLRRQAASLRRLLARYAYNGLSRQEVRILDNGVSAVRRQLRLERRDLDGRRG